MFDWILNTPFLYINFGIFKEKWSFSKFLNILYGRRKRIADVGNYVSIRDFFISFCFILLMRRFLYSKCILVPMRQWFMRFDLFWTLLYCDHMHYTINIWSKYEKISRKLEFGTGCRSPLSIPVINFSFLRLKMDISWSGDQSLLPILNKFQKTFYRDVDFQRTNNFMKEVREVFNLSELKF